MTRDNTIDLLPGAVALRCVRVVGDDFRYYEAMTFPDNPWQGCEMWLRRCHVFGMLVSDDADIVIDILDANGDIIQDFPLSRAGLRYLKSQLRFRVDRGDD